jgi:hypothetical protein
MNSGASSRKSTCQPRRLVGLAKRERRSLNVQVVVLLERVRDRSSGTRTSRGTTQNGRGSNWIKTTLKQAGPEGDAERWVPRTGQRRRPL